MEEKCERVGGDPSFEASRPMNVRVGYPHLWQRASKIGQGILMPEILLKPIGITEKEGRRKSWIWGDGKGGGTESMQPGGTCFRGV